MFPTTCENIPHNKLFITNQLCYFFLDAPLL